MAYMMFGLLFKTAKKVAQATLKYSIYIIYKCGRNHHYANPSSNNLEFRRIEKKDIIDSDDLPIKEQGWYGGDGSYIFACIVDERILGLCIYWHGDRYLQRNFWPLKRNEAKLVQLLTLPEMRGRGIASMLIQYSSKAMLEDGFVNLFARVWHSNNPSRKAFENNGWKVISRVIEIQPIKRIKPLRLCIKK